MLNGSKQYSRTLHETGGFGFVIRGSSVRFRLSAPSPKYQKIEAVTADFPTLPNLPDLARCPDVLYLSGTRGEAI